MVRFICSPTVIPTWLWALIVFPGLSSVTTQHHDSADWRGILLAIVVITVFAVAYSCTRVGKALVVATKAADAAYDKALNDGGGR